MCFLIYSPYFFFLFPPRLFYIVNCYLTIKNKLHKLIFKILAERTSFIKLSKKSIFQVFWFTGNKVCQNFDRIVILYFLNKWFYISTPIFKKPFFTNCMFCMFILSEENAATLHYLEEFLFHTKNSQSITVHSIQRVWYACV